ncbi:MFS transporter [Pseudomonas japonica]|uniref:MFS transporter n=1 Tax=Pseudomonas TaxID=286 RepID=UPI0029282D69|nr:MFS transporter [Pseudomonas sp. zfem002]MDU9392876.1 MFS transporter [Pseudomonas sp. zfem002]
MLETTSREKEGSWTYQGWRVALAGMLALIAGPSVFLLSFGIFVQPMGREFGWTVTQITLAITLMSFALVLLAPLQGYLVDRFGARRVILPSILCFAAAVVMMSRLGADLWLYYLAWLVLCIAGIGCYPLSYLRAVGTWFDRRLGFSLGIANAGVGIGGALLPLVLALVIPALGWRWGFLCIAMMALITFPIAFFFIRENAQAGPAKVASGALEGVAFADAIRTRDFQLLTLTFILMGFVTTGLIVHQIPILTEAGISPQRAALMQATFGVFAIVGRVVTGLLLDYICAQLLMMVVVLGASLSCVLYAVGVGPQLAFVAAALVGLLLGAEFDILGFLLKKHFGIRSFGRLYGIVYAVFQLSAGIGAAVLSLMKDSFAGYSTGLMLFAAVLVVCAGTLFWHYLLEQAARSPSRQVAPPTHP